MGPPSGRCAVGVSRCADNGAGALFADLGSGPAEGTDAMNWLAVPAEIYLYCADVDFRKSTLTNQLAVGRNLCMLNVLDSVNQDGYVLGLPPSREGIEYWITLWSGDVNSILSL